ncbi:MAG: RDD family protein [Steroidobacteraceae bacterium]
MAEAVLTVRSLTGVEMTLPVAGPGMRSYAFLIDWQIRLLGALAVLLIVVLLRLLPGLPKALAAHLLVGGGIVALLIYLLYQPVAEIVTGGRTPGLRAAGARIVTLEGTTPGVGSLLIRNIFRLIDSLPLCYVVGLITCMLTDRHVRLGDIVAGTVMVCAAEAAGGPLDRLARHAERSALTPDTAELVHDLLERFNTLAPAQRTALALAVLGKIDPGFDASGTPPEEGVLRARLEALLGPVERS